MISEDIIEYLEDQNIGSKYPEGQLFMGFMPDSPANIIVVRDESAPLIGESQGYPVDASGIQILVRNDNQVEARNTCLAIHNKIAGFNNSFFTEDGYPIVHTDVITSPNYLGPDDENRHTWVVHYAFRIGNETTHRTLT